MIQIKNLSKSYNKIKVLDDISLDIKDGEVSALLGPNGGGKTTLIKSILGLRFPDSGIILKNSDTLTKIPIGYMPQIPNFPDNLKVIEIMEIIEKLESIPPFDKEYLIDSLNMSLILTKRFCELSGGMKQKVNILQCFSFRKSIYILDEPTSSLDPEMSYFLKYLIKKKENTTILFTSHILSEVQELAGRIILLVEGKLLFHGTGTEAIKKYNKTNLEDSLLSFWEKRS
jgi:Cu-processing system ATP-binding protein